MASLKIVIAFATCVTLAASMSLEDVQVMYMMAPYALSSQIESGNKFCSENSVSNTSREHYEELIRNAQNCYIDIKNNSRQSICTNFEKNIYTCSQPLIEFFEDCLPEKSKDLPRALARTVESVVRTICDNSVELLIELMNPCIYGYFEQNDDVIKEECRRDVLEPKFMRLAKEEYPSKSEVCQIAREFGNCWRSHVDQACNSLQAKSTFLTFYKALFVACKE